MELQLRHWLIALLLAGLLHAALALALVPKPTSPTPETVTILLGHGRGGDDRPEGGEGREAGAAGALSALAPETTVASAHPHPQETLAADAVTEVLEADSIPTPPETNAPLTPAASESLSARQPSVFQTPKQKTRPQVQPASAPLTTAAEPTPTPEPVRQKQADPRPKPESTTQHASQPAPEPRPRSKTATSADARTPAARARTTPDDRPRAGRDARASASTPASGEARGQGRQAAAGRGSGAGLGKQGTGRGRGQGAGTGAGGARNYYGQLAAWLNRHKRYPSRARRMRQQGTVQVRFTIDRNGRVVSHQVIASSGHPLLDQEAAAMLERASPMPRMPPTLAHQRLTITLPIAFNLR
jgi:protein TonB